MTSAFGRESSKKFPASNRTRSDSPFAADKFLERRPNRGEVEADAGEVGMGTGERHRQQTLRGSISRKVL